MEIEDKDEIIDISSCPRKHILYTSECSKILTKLGLEKVVRLMSDSNNISKVIIKKEVAGLAVYTKIHFKKIYCDLMGYDESILKGKIDQYTKIVIESDTNADMEVETNNDAKEDSNTLYEEELIKEGGFDIENFIQLSKLVIDTDFYYTKIHKIEDNTRDSVNKKFIEFRQHNDGMLDVRKTLQGDFAMEWFSDHFYTVRNLKDLDITGNKIGYEMFVYFCDALKYIQELEYLWMGENNITDKGFSYFSQKLSYIPLIKTIAAEKNGITDESYQIFLTRIGECVKLDEIFVTNNYIREKYDLTLQGLYPGRKISIQY